MVMLASLLTAGVAALAVAWLYNRLVQARNQVQAAWSDIDVQLSRRHDLVPRLVTAVQAYANHERATLSAVTALREASRTAARLPERAQLEDDMTRAVHRLLALGEAYPALRASDNFLSLQHELAAIEDYLQFARRFYNGAVRVLNTRIESFPDLLVARPLGFRPAEYFAVAGESVRAAPRVELSA